MRRGTLPSFLLLMGLALTSFAESLTDGLEVSASGTMLLPIGDSSSFYSASWGGRGTASLKDLFFLRPLLEVQTSQVVVQDGTTISLRSAGLGGEYQLMLDTHIGLSAALKGGLYQASRNTQSASSWWAGLQAGGLYRFTPGFSLSTEVELGSWDGGTAPLLQGLAASITAHFSFGSSAGSVKAELELADSIYPILHTWYGENSYANVRVSNLEDGAIENLQVGIYIPQFMDQPQFSVPYPSVGRNQSVRLPVKSLFSDAVFKLSEDTKVSGDLTATYTFLGERREKHFPVTIPVLNRNALSWDDDLKAAAFVGPKDPAVLRFTKYSAGLVREAGNKGLSDELAFAVGLLEGFKSLGVRYVIDPTTPYAETSANSRSVDYLQYPFQTILYKGGDCDDLSILYCSMLESIGIPAAFITVPGHIYTALDLGLTEAEARATYSSTNDLIFLDGRTWLPVEATLSNQGFLKAWQSGASQWRQYNPAGQARLIPIREAWRTYPPVGIPGEEGRFALPEAGPLMAVWTQSMAEISKRELDPKLAQLRAEMAKGNEKGVAQNKLGILYARFGYYKEAETEFQGAAKLGSSTALVNLGKVAMLTKRPQAAVDSFRKAVAARPTDQNALAGLINALTELGQTAEAAKLKATQP